MRKKIVNYALNVLLIIIVLILLIPNWRVSFQGWFQSFFLNEVEFKIESELQIPSSAQNWALFDMQSTMISFADFKGKPIIISFWATWCPPCRAELPELNLIKNKFKNQLHVIAVSEETIDVIKNSGLTDDYNFLYSTPKYPDFFNVESFPTLIVVDSDMTIVFKNIGAGSLNNEKNIRFLEELIRK